ncbi:hypothetical protein D3C87_1469370 [compost metagenome]
MPLETLLGREARSDKNEQDRTQRDNKQHILQDRRDKNDNRHQNGECLDPHAFSRGKVIRLAVPSGVELRYQPADPRDGMADQPEQPIRVAGKALQDQREECKKEHCCGKPKG